MNWIEVLVCAYSAIATALVVRVVWVSGEFDALAQRRNIGLREESDFCGYWLIVLRFWVWDIEKFRKL